MKINGVLAQIELAVDELPISEEKVARYVLSHPEEIMHMTINQLAEASKASSSAVVRLCKSLGIEGFPSLKVRLSAEVVSHKPLRYLDIESEEEISSIVQKTMYNSIQTFQDTAGQLSRDAIEKAVEIIQQADIIYLYGVGASLVVAEDAAQKWNRLGKPSYVISDRHLLAQSMVTQSQKAVFWGISYSGETHEVIQLVKKAKELKMKTIGLSRIGNNKLSQSVDVTLTTARAPEAKLRSAATSSRFAQLFVIDVIFFAYASSQYEQTIEQLEKTKNIIENLENEFK